MVGTPRDQAVWGGLEATLWGPGDHQAICNDRCPRQVGLKRDELLSGLYINPDNSRGVVGLHTH